MSDSAYWICCRANISRRLASDGVVTAVSHEGLFSLHFSLDISFIFVYNVDSGREKEKAVEMLERRKVMKITKKGFEFHDAMSLLFTAWIIPPMMGRPHLLNYFK